MAAHAQATDGSESRVKRGLRWLLAIVMIGAGINHFRSADTYIAMMPEALPAHGALVAISGIAEILCGVGLLVERTRRFAAWSLIALLVAVFPANINMAVNNLPLGGEPVPAWLLWARLPLQAVLIAWAYWYTRPEERA